MKNKSARLVSRAWAPRLKAVAYLLSALLLLHAVPTNVYAELIDAVESALDNSDQITDTTNGDNVSDPAVFEMLDRREEDAKHFRTADGSFVAVQYGVPVHEKDENGEWQDIDNTLSESGSEYATPNARVKFAKKTPGNGTLFTLHEGNRKITMSLAGANKKVAGQVTNTQTEFSEDATQLQKLMTLDKLSSKILYPEILDGVNLEYVVDSCNIKENIIVKERAASYSYTFEIQLNNLEAALMEDGSVSITDPNTDEVVYTIPKGYMLDADGKYSNAVEYVLVNNGNGKYTLTVVADAEWINAEDRVFPVTVDPPITASSTVGMTDTYIDSATPITTYYIATDLKIGRTASGITQVSLWKLNSMPAIPANAYIVSAEFSLKCTSSTALPGDKIGVYTVETDWTTNNAYAWSSADLTTLCAESRLIDYATMQNVTSGSTVTWDITSAFRTWYGDNSVSMGIALAPLTPYAMSAVFASANASAVTRPQLIVEYRDMKGIESYWSGSSHSAGSAGSGFVNHASGNLVFSVGTVSTADSLFNLTPALVYNSALADKYNYISHNQYTPYPTISTGYGWKLSLSESIVKPTGANYYVWIDGDGTEHYFLPDTVAGSSVYKDEDGLLLTLTVSSNGYTITDVDGNVRHFDKMVTSSPIAEGGTLDYIQDAYGNKLEFTLNEIYWQPESVSLYPSGHSTPITYLTLAYNQSRVLKEIRNHVTGQVVTFLYSPSFTGTSSSFSSDSSGALRQVKYGHLSGSATINDLTITYSYTPMAGSSSGSIYRLANAKDESTGTAIQYVYDTSGRVSKVIEHGRNENGIDVLGQSILFTYGSDYAEIRSSGADDVLQNEDDIITHYSLDYQGRAVSAYSTNAARTAMYGATNNAFEYHDSENGSGTGDSGNTKNSLKASAVINGVAVNHLYNGCFEYGNDVNTSTGSDTIFGWVKSADNINFTNQHEYSLSRMVDIPVLPGATASIYQDVILTSGTYTLSADCYTGIEGTKITLKASGGSMDPKEETYTMYHVIDTANALSPSLTFTVPTNQTVRITIEVQGAGTQTNNVYIDNVMLENNIGAGSFNAVQFGGFTDTYPNTNNSASPATYWSRSNADAEILAEVGLQGHGIRITGDINEYQWVSQRITVTDQALIDQAQQAEITTAKLMQSRIFTVSGFAKAAAQIANEEAFFSIDVDIYYVGDPDNRPGDTLYFDFNKEITDWQFLSATFTTPPNKIVQYIDINLTYANQPNEAYFDNISLVEEKGNFAANYMYNDEGLLEFTYTPADCVYYEYDANDNLIFAYDSQGNGHYSQYSGKTLISDTTFKYEFQQGDLDLLSWYLNGKEIEEDNLVDQLTYNVITKTVYNINVYGLNLSTLSYAAEGSINDATYIADTPRIGSGTTYNLTAGSALFGRVTSTTDTAGFITQYVYDSHARLLFEYRQDKEGLYYNYDALGRLTNVTPLAYSSSDGSFNPQTGVENVRYTYDPQTIRLTNISTATTTYTFTYDAFGNTKKIQAGGSTLAEYEYNYYNGKLAWMKYGTDKSITYTYDELDRVKTISYTDNANVTQSYTYVYTAAGAIHSIEATESGRLYLYNYNSKGQLIGYTECAKDSQGNYTTTLQNHYVYDDRDRIDYWQGSFDYVASNGNTYSNAVGYEYIYQDYDSISFPDKAGELAELTVLEAGLNRETSIAYSYDELYRLESKALNTADDLSIVTSYTYRGNISRSSMLVKSYTSAVSGDSGTSSMSLSYSYDVDWNIIDITDGNGKKISYVYDDLGQLTRENNQVLGKTYVYSYDNGGNRTSKKTYTYTTGSLASLTYTEEKYEYNNAWGDQLTKVGSTTISYDAIGNPSTFNGYVLTWHGRQLKEMSRNAGQSLLKFKYNADGIRTNKIANGVDHVYTLNGSQIVSESWNNNLLIYLYDESGSPIGMQYRTTSYAANTFDTFYFEKNLQGDIIAVYNASGRKIGSYTYDAWGNCTVTLNSANTTLEANIAKTYNPFRYRGYYYDTETQLYYLQSRYYNPAWGRFLNVDAYISTGAGLISCNMYAYCNNEPVLGYDPTGHEDLCVEDEIENFLLKHMEIIRGSNSSSAGPSGGSSVMASLPVGLPGNNTFIKNKGTKSPKDVHDIVNGEYTKLTSYPSGQVYSRTLFYNGQQLIRIDYMGPAHRGVLPHIHVYSYNDVNQRNGEIIFDMSGNILEKSGRYKH